MSQIVEFPDGKFDTSLQAIEAAFQHILSRARAGEVYLLSGQSYENDGEQYLMFDVRYQDGAFEFERKTPQALMVARSVGIPTERISASDDGRTMAIENASVGELTRFLDRLYRDAYKIKLLSGTDSYNFGAEVMTHRHDL